LLDTVTVAAILLRPPSKTYLTSSIAFFNNLSRAAYWCWESVIIEAGLVFLTPSGAPPEVSPAITHLSLQGKSYLKLDKQVFKKSFIQQF
jgi:hypothetical protein